VPYSGPADLGEFKLDRKDYRMRRLVSLLALVSVFSIVGFAASWSGTLLDASCYNTQKSADTCMATSKTTAFGVIDTAGKFYKLDAKGNSLATAALKNRADRAADPANPSAAKVSATVTGTDKSGTIEVESIDIK
jgi:hypothetical protein